MLQDWNTLAHEVHTVDNHRWWHDQNGARLDRNKGELIALIHSEISECFDGLMSRKVDDKLPQFMNADVELADFVIRTLDYAGAFSLDLNDTTLPPPFKTGTDWLHLVTSHLLEAVRKGEPEAPHVSRMIRMAYLMAQFYQFNLDETIAAKRAFNAKRHDHTHEARYAEGGKKF